VLHQVGVSFDLYYDARKHKIKTVCAVLSSWWWTEKPSENMQSI